MLHILRSKNVSKIVLWAIFILILPAFVLFGTGNLGSRGDKGPKFVGLIDNKKITFDEFSNCLTAIRCQIMLNYFNQPKVLDTFLKEKAFVGKLAWDRCIMLKEANKRAIKVSDKELVQFIKTHPLFSRSGIFDDKLYVYVLQRSFGVDQRKFEEMTRDSLKIQKLNDMLAKGITVNDAEVLEDYKKENEKFKLSYIIIPTTDLLNKITLDEKEIKKYYEEHKNQFTVVSKDPKEEKPQPTALSFDEVKDGIKTFLSEKKAEPLAVARAQEVRKEIVTIMGTDKMTFEQAAAKIGTTITETTLFGIKDYLDGIGEAEPIVNILITCKKDDVPQPLPIRKGALIFSVKEIQPIDEAKFKKDKEDYSKRTFSKKKLAFLEGWLRQLETKTTLNIDLNDYEKYYY